MWKCDFNNVLLWSTFPHVLHRNQTSFLSRTSHLHMMNDSVIYTNRDGIPHMLEMPDASIHFAGSVVCGRVGRALPYSSPIHVASLLAAVWIGLKLFSAAEQTLYTFKLAHTNCCKWVVTAKSSKPGRAMAKKSLQNDGFILIANWMYDQTCASIFCGNKSGASVPQKWRRRSHFESILYYYLDMDSAFVN